MKLMRNNTYANRLKRAEIRGGLKEREHSNRVIASLLRLNARLQIGNSRLIQEIKK